MHDDDLDRELRAHLDLEAEELRAAGSSPEEALHAARRTLGNTTLLKETIRDMASWTSFERLFQDLRYGVRFVAADSRLQPRCDPDPGARHRRQHGNFQCGQRTSVAA